jgi:hypothetical protein
MFSVIQCLATMQASSVFHKVPASFLVIKYQVRYEGLTKL